MGFGGWGLGVGVWSEPGGGGGGLTCSTHARDQAGAAIRGGSARKSRDGRTVTCKQGCTMLQLESVRRRERELMGGGGVRELMGGGLGGLGG